MIEDVVTSLSHHGFRRIVIVNGHRIANVPPLAIGASRAAAKTGALVVVADIALLAHDEYTTWMAEDGGPMGHGDDYETSHMIHCRPDLVDLDRVVPGRTDAPAAHTHRNMSPFADANRAAWWPALPQSPAGHVDMADPGWASAEIGRALHEAIVRDLGVLVREVEAAELPAARSYPAV